MSQLFHKTFASGLTGATGFDSVTATNGTVAHSAGAGLNGTSGGITCTRTANSPNAHGVCAHVLSGKAVFRTAFYVDLTLLTIGTDTQSVLLWSPRIASTGAALGSLRAIKSSGVVYLECRQNGDAGGLSGGNVAFTVPPTWVEVEVIKETSDGAANGEMRFYFGGGDWPSTGQQVYEFLSVDNYINFNACVNARVGLGSGSSSVGGSMLFDEWTARDDNTPILAGRASISVSVSGFGGVSASIKKTASLLSSVSGSGSISASVQKVASAPVQLSGFGDLSLSVFKEALIPIAVSGWGDVGMTVLEEVIQLYGDILRPTREQLRVHGTQRETLRIAQPMQEKLWVSSL